ncbi:MAG: histidine phosphatase family protein [Actinomycetota bacterium]|nr:histidine phosphatase family protein [Actinomycetota bacterium]
MAATRLVLVRHGASRSTEIQIVGGHLGCRGLSVEGVFQSERLSRRWLHNPPFDMQFPYGGAYSSVMRRSQETAVIVLSPMGLSLDGSSCDLCEVHPGVTDAITWKEVSEKYQGRDMLADPSIPIALGGESWNQMSLRVVDFFSRIVYRHRGQTVIAFTHNGVIDATLERWLRGSPRGVGLGSEPTGITTWIVETGGNGEFRPTLVSYNDFSHLDGSTGQTPSVKVWKNSANGEDVTGVLASHPQDRLTS